MLAFIKPLCYPTPKKVECGCKSAIVLLLQCPTCVCVCALLCFVVQMRGGSVCSRWLRPQMAKRSWEGEYNLLLCFKAVTDGAEMSTEGSL